MDFLNNSFTMRALSLSPFHCVYLNVSFMLLSNTLAGDFPSFSFPFQSKSVYEYREESFAGIPNV